MAICFRPTCTGMFNTMMVAAAVATSTTSTTSTVSLATTAYLHISNYDEMISIKLLFHKTERLILQTSDKNQNQHKILL